MTPRRTTPTETAASNRVPSRLTPSVQRTRLPDQIADHLIRDFLQRWCNAVELDALFDEPEDVALTFCEICHFFPPRD